MTSEVQKNGRVISRGLIVLKIDLVSLRNGCQECIVNKIEVHVRGMFEMNCLFLSGDFTFQVSPKVLIPCPRSTPRG